MGLIKLAYMQDNAMKFFEDTSGEYDKYCKEILNRYLPAELLNQEEYDFEEKIREGIPGIAGYRLLTGRRVLPQGWWPKELAKAVIAHIANSENYIGCEVNCVPSKGLYKITHKITDTSGTTIQYVSLFKNGRPNSALKWIFVE